MQERSQESRPSLIKPEGTFQFRRLAARYWPVLALTVLAIVLTSRGITEGGFRYSDCSRHAMDGVFVLDVISDLPTSLANPLEYALKYYAHYPCLGIPLYYPPFFAMVEAVFFAVFGISVFTARLTVVAFSVLAAVMMYKLIKLMAGPRAAFLSTALFLAIPAVVLWSRQVMLEMPTTAMILTATYFFYKYAQLHHRPSAVWAGLFTAAAVMTKQVALFLVPAFAAYLILRRRWAAFKQWQFWVGTMITAVFVVPYFVVTFRYTHYLSRRVGTSRFADGTTIRVLHSWAEVLSPYGVALAACAAVACVICQWNRRRKSGLYLPVVMIVFFLLLSVYVNASAQRYAFLGIPFLVCLGPLLMDRLQLLRRKAVFVVAVIAVLALAGFSYTQHVPVVLGYDKAGQAMAQHSRSSPFVLFDGFRDGDVTFFVRQQDPARERYVLRGSKMLYTFASFKEYGYQDFITTEEGFTALVEQYGIRCIAVENRDLFDTQPGALLRKTLADPNRFDLVGRFPITAPRTRLDQLNVLVYVPKGRPRPPTGTTLTIPLAGLQRTIELPIDGEGHPTISYTPWKGQK